MVYNSAIFLHSHDHPKADQIWQRYLKKCSKSYFSKKCQLLKKMLGHFSFIIKLFPYIFLIGNETNSVSSVSNCVMLSQSIWNFVFMLCPEIVQ